MKEVAEKKGAIFHFNQNVEKIVTEQGVARAIVVNGVFKEFDAISFLILNHTLFFENDLDEHIKSIYEEKKWPEKPLFYACCPSQTDPEVAPQGHENVVLLMPLATGLNDEESTREHYFEDMIKRLEKHTGAKDLLSKLNYKRSYCVDDFISDYNAYGGNAYGLANTLSQTAVLKPSIKNKHLSNLFYTGQLTVPGPGVPPSIISGKIVAKEVNNLKLKRREKIV
jgi:phytoene desaturase